MKTNNFRLKIFRRCPKCFCNMYADLDINNSYYYIKNNRKSFIKTERGDNTFYFDYKLGPIKMCIIYDFNNENNKNPQNRKIRISKLFKESKKTINKTYNQIYCIKCGYYEFVENASYMDVLRDK